jgi:hypothetical protein
LERLFELAALYPRYGYEMLTKKLRREGFLVNVKRIRLLCPREGLKLRSKPRKKWTAAAVREGLIRCRAVDTREGSRCRSQP